MLVKLLKYELRSTSRIALVIYGAVLAVAVLLGIFLRVTASGIENDTLGLGVEIALFSLLSIYFFLIVALGIVTMVMIIVRFYRNLLQGEGYLMHTLPVPTWMLVTSKLITALLWQLLMTAVCVLSGLLIGSVSGLFSYILREIDLLEVLQSIRETIDMNFPLFLGCAFFSAAGSILEFYFSMAVGNLSNSHKILAAGGTYIALQIVKAVISSVVSISVIAVAENFTFNTITLPTMLYSIVLAVLCFIGTERILSTRLNLA